MASSNTAFSPAPHPTVGDFADGGTMRRMFLTVNEAAERLGVTRGWIYERTRRKATPPKAWQIRAIYRAGPPSHRRCLRHGNSSVSQGGCIVKPSGARKTWSIKYRDPTGEQLWEGKFKTKNAARARLNEILGQIDKGTYARPSSVTFEVRRGLAGGATADPRKHRIRLWVDHQSATDPSPRIDRSFGAPIRSH